MALFHLSQYPGVVQGPWALAGAVPDHPLLWLLEGLELTSDLGKLVVSHPPKISLSCNYQLHSFLLLKNGDNYFVPTFHNFSDWICALQRGPCISATGWPHFWSFFCCFRVCSSFKQTAGLVPKADRWLCRGTCDRSHHVLEKWTGLMCDHP